MWFLVDAWVLNSKILSLNLKKEGVDSKFQRVAILLSWESVLNQGWRVILGWTTSCRAKLAVWRLKKGKQLGFRAVVMLSVLAEEGRSDFVSFG